jgi:PAS domain S-box-containing protein
VKLLYVEDNLADADLARRQLTRLAPEISLEIQFTLKDAIAWLEDHACDVILTDLNLPDGDGLSLLSYVRSRGMHVPVVVITGLGDEETAVNALKAGADDYLVKRANYLARLPLVLEDVAAGYQMETRRRSRPIHLLYVEHSSIDVDLTRRHLTSHAPYIQMEVVPSAAEGLARLQSGEKSQRYDVVLLDYRLPDMTALEVFKEIRQVYHLDIPVVVVTGEGNNEIAVQMYKLGVSDYLVKDPGYLYRLPGVIENAFHRSQLEREQAAVRESEARFRAIFEQAAAGIAQIGMDEQFQQVNQKLCNILGYPREELLACALMDVLHPEDQEDCQTGLHSLLKGEMVAFDREVRCIHKDRRPVWAQLTLSLVQGESPPSLYFVAIWEDITARKHSEEVSQRLTAIIETTPDLVGTINLENNTFYLNPAGRKMLGIGAEEDISGFHISHMHPWYAATRILEAAIPTATREGSWSGESVLASREGKEIPVSQVVIAHKGPEGGVAYLSTIARDISEIKRARQEIQHRLEQLASLRAIDASITSSVDLRMVLDVLLDQVIARLGVDAADILLLRPYNNILECAAAKGFTSLSPRSTQVSADQGLPGQVYMQRNLLFISDLRTVEANLTRTYLVSDEGFTSYCAVPLIIKGVIHGVLEVYTHERLEPDAEWLNFIETLGQQAAIAVDNANMFEDLQRSNLELVLAYDATIEGWSRALDMRDKETEGHTLRVTDTTLDLARAMAFSSQELQQIRRGALLHDIGKLGVPDYILLKPGPLTEEEWQIMRQHPLLAYEMLSPITYLRQALDIPYCHHEKWDGSGYPRQLSGEQIPLAARIFAVVDVYDALTSERPYRKPWSKEQAVEYIREQAGKHFDPAISRAFCEMLGDQMS